MTDYDWLTKVRIDADCYVQLKRWPHGIPADVAICYTEHSPAYGYSNEETTADIDADTARAIVALLVEAFGPAVLPPVGGAA